MDVLFASDVRAVDALAVLADAQQLRVDEGDSQMNPYAAELVEGVTSHRDRIDEIVATYSLGWTIDRMPGIDRNLLRIGTYELLWSDVPPGAVIDEAVELARELSTDESPGFVNGVLARIAEERSTLDVGV